MSFTTMLNKLQGQPESYEKKAQYKFGRTLGAGTYGIVREAEGPNGKAAVKIILKKNVKGNEQMVYDELDMLQRLHHPHIVRFHDWFESRDKYYIVTQLATGGELFDRICDYGKFTEKDASQTILQVLDAVNYLHERNIVHRDLKPENLLYLTRAQDSQLVLADFGIAKMLHSPSEVLTNMAGSFGYAAPEVMLKQGHGKAVDMWSLGVITYTLLCGYSPFRSENLQDLIDECRSGHIVCMKRYWRDVSKDPRIISSRSYRLTQPNEQQAYMAKARLKRGIEIVKLANRIEALKMQGEDDDDIPSAIPDNTTPSSNSGPADQTSPVTAPTNKKRSLSRAAKSAIFREVVLAKVREMRQEEQKEKVEKEALERAEKEKHK
ncbi:calcium/calmodulin-dependent protein kinase [Coccidioides immitis H538.4]|uniref:Calcium/calmodulin-dependent protein kinase n=1 Tax=Coccidioides immitis H538.4 TaxID=396776 RepID=A0A0J8RNX6_COCIT|nr:calcium/calmodulin-dependent protein kinase [Coccidioides immitis H538.4]